MGTAGRRPPFLDYDMRWPDANHNIGCGSAEGQGTRKNHSDQSFKNHMLLARHVRGRTQIRGTRNALPCILVWPQICSFSG